MHICLTHISGHPLKIAFCYVLDNFKPKVLDNFKLKVLDNFKSKVKFTNFFLISLSRDNIFANFKISHNEAKLINVETSITIYLLYQIHFFSPVKRLYRYRYDDCQIVVVSPLAARDIFRASHPHDCTCNIMSSRNFRQKRRPLGNKSAP